MTQTKKGIKLVKGKGKDKKLDLEAISEATDNDGQEPIENFQNPPVDVSDEDREKLRGSDLTADGQQSFEGMEPEYIPELVKAARAVKAKGIAHSKSTKELVDLKDELEEVCEANIQHFWKDPDQGAKEDGKELWIYKVGDVKIYYARDIKTSVKVTIEKAKESAVKVA